jgi:DNA polymerase III delta prime subunit
LNNGLFSKGLKFIILDEVDYMTKSAQLGLKYLIENSNENIRYCLICNYISKIDKSLQNSFIKLKFNSLPENEIVVLLRDISINEKLNLGINKLTVIQKYFDSDIRSMINYMQINKLNVNLIDNNILDNLIDKEITLEGLKSKINKISIEYNIDRYCLIKDYIKYIITNKKILITLDKIGSLECIIRGLDVVNNSNLHYILIKLLHLIKLLDSE